MASLSLAREAVTSAFTSSKLSYSAQSFSMSSLISSDTFSFCFLHFLSSSALWDVADWAWVRRDDSVPSGLPAMSASMKASFVSKLM